MAGEGAAATVRRGWWPTLDAACTATDDSSDDGWCERAAAVQVVCCMLTTEAEVGEGDVAAGVAALDRALGATTSFPLIVSALPHLARVLGLLPALRPLFFALLDRVEGVKDYALASLPPPTTLTPRVQSLLPLFAADVRAVWSPLVVAQAVLDHTRTQRLSAPLPATLVEVAACAVADASSPAFSAAFAAVVPGVLAALMPGVRDGEGRGRGVVLGVLGMVLGSEVTRGQGLWALHEAGKAEGVWAGLGGEALQAVVEWMWGWVEGDEGGDGEETREGREVVVEAMRRMVVGWKATISAEEWQSAGVDDLLTRMEEGQAKPRDAAEWEEKRADPLQP